METTTRKRARSGEFPFVLQQKIHINQKVVNSRSREAMKNVYNKTITKLFQGLQNLDNNNSKTPEISQLVTLQGTGDLIFHSKDKPIEFPTEKLKSKCCGKYAFIAGSCLNCNLNICEHCASSCTGCGAFLCGTCITLFECGTLEQPMCERCKMFL